MHQRRFITLAEIVVSSSGHGRRSTAIARHAPAMPAASRAAATSAFRMVDAAAWRQVGVTVEGRRPAPTTCSTGPTTTTSDERGPTAIAVVTSTAAA